MTSPPPDLGVEPGAVVHGRSFFDLQLSCAERVAAIAGVPLARAVLDYTNVFIRFGLGRDVDAEHPVWREYAAGLERSGDPREWTYRFYLRRPEATTAPPVVTRVGCFSYARLGDGRLRLHFRNSETDDRSPLARDRRPTRMRELAALSVHMRRRQGASATVVGGSWLYNLEAYRRLFPPAFIATARPAPPRFRHMTLWGQFVDRHGETREAMTRPFLARLARLSALDDLGACFPFPVLALAAPAAVFADFYVPPLTTRV